MKCLKCGMENNNTKFCINCGNPLEISQNIDNGISQNSISSVPNVEVPNNQNTEIFNQPNGEVSNQSEYITPIIPQMDMPTVEQNTASVTPNVNTIDPLQSINPSQEQVVQPITNEQVQVNEVNNPNPIQTESEEIKVDNLNTADPASQEQKDGIDYDFYEKPKKRWPIVIIVIVIILLAIVGAYEFLILSPKNNFKLNMYKIYTKFNANIPDEINSMSGQLSYDANIEGTTEENEIIDLINKLTLSLVYNIDYKNKIINVDYGSNYDKDEIAKGNIYTENNTAYVKIDNITETHLKTAINKETYDSLFKSENVKDSKIILNSVKKAFDKSLKDSYFTKETTKETINGKSESVVKNIFLIDNKNRIELTKSILTILKLDKEFITSVKKLTEKDPTESIDYIINNSKVDEEDKTVYKIVLYTKSFIGTLVKVDLEVNEETVDFYKDDYDSNNVPTKTTVSLVEFIINNDNDYVLKVSSDNKELITATINNSKESGLNVYKINTEYEKSKINLTLKYSVDYNKTVVKEDVSKAIELNSLTEEQKQQILDKFNAKPGFVAIKKDVLEFIQPQLNMIYGAKKSSASSQQRETEEYGIDLSDDLDDEEVEY